MRQLKRANSNEITSIVEACCHSFGAGLYWYCRVSYLKKWRSLTDSTGAQIAITSEKSSGEVVAATTKVIVNEQAQANLGLTAQELKPQTYWKTIQVPGMVVDRPGLSDCGVVAPATGVVANDLPPKKSTVC